MTEEWRDGMPDIFVRAAPGERVVEDGFAVTATADYRYTECGLFRRFVWCNTPIGPEPPGWPRGEWFAVRCHWKQLVKNGRRA